MESGNTVVEPSTTMVESKEAKKRQEKDRKKGGKKIESFMKSIANLAPDEKVEVLSKKNTESIEEIRNFKNSVQILQRRILVLEKEKEQLQNDQSKGLLARSRLETLCRELQRQNKSIKDESLQKIREEEEKRKEVSFRFQTALNEVSQMMQQNTDKNLKLRDDNIEISNKFQKLCEEFKTREEEVIRLTRQLDLEKQLAEATLKRAECQLNAEREIWNKEKEHYIAQIKVNDDKKKSLETNIKGLEEYVSMYSTKYDEFENTISKSNQVFDSYKVEMNRMSKQMTKFEQECNIWKERWLQSQQTINRITSEHRACEQNIQDRDKKIKNLADLCRSIQDERAAYLKQLKENELTPVAVVHEAKPNLISSTTSQNTKTRSNSHAMTKKEKELTLLKKEMQAIETKLADTIKTSLIESKHDTTNIKSDSVNTIETKSEEPSAKINDSEENKIKIQETKNEGEGEASLNISNKNENIKEENVEVNEVIEAKMEVPSLKVTDASNDQVKNEANPEQKLIKSNDKNEDINKPENEDINKTQNEEKVEDESNETVEQSLLKTVNKNEEINLTHNEEKNVVKNTGQTEVNCAKINDKNEDKTKANNEAKKHNRKENKQNKNDKKSKS